MSREKLIMETNNEEKTTVSTNQLRHILVKYFNLSELQNLAFDLKVDYENLSGESKEDKGRELITYLERRGHISELVQMIHQVRPHAMQEASGHKSNMPSTPSKLLGKSLYIDRFTNYEVGLDNLVNHIEKSHPRYVEGLGYCNRLLENVTQARRHGDSEIRRTERSEIITQLNDLTLFVLGKSFNELCMYY